MLELLAKLADRLTSARTSVVLFFGAVSLVAAAIWLLGPLTALTAALGLQKEILWVVVGLAVFSAGSLIGHGILQLFTWFGRIRSRKVQRRELKKDRERQVANLHDRIALVFPSLPKEQLEALRTVAFGDGILREDNYHTRVLMESQWIERLHAIDSLRRFFRLSPDAADPIKRQFTHADRHAAESALRKLTRDERLLLSLFSDAGLSDEAYVESGRIKQSVFAAAFPLIAHHVLTIVEQESKKGESLVLRLSSYAIELLETSTDLGPPAIHQATVRLCEVDGLHASGSATPSARYTGA